MGIHSPRHIATETRIRYAVVTVQAALDRLLLGRDGGNRGLDVLRHYMMNARSCPKWLFLPAGFSAEQQPV